MSVGELLIRNRERRSHKLIPESRAHWLAVAQRRFLSGIVFVFRKNQVDLNYVNKRLKRFVHRVTVRNLVKEVVAENSQLKILEIVRAGRERLSVHRDSVSEARSSDILGPAEHLGTGRVATIQK